jgi:DNA-binding MarR family transcriptional regulator
MNLSTASREVLNLYPRIFFACHTRHRRDPKTRKEISSHQASILDHLDSVDPTSLVELAQHMGVTPGTMSLSVQRLVRDRYVVRERDETDARRVHLRLSPSGVRVKETDSVLDPKRLELILKHLSPKERDYAVRGLGLLAGAAQKEMHTKSMEGAWRRGAGSANVVP